MFPAPGPLVFLALLADFLGILVGQHELGTKNRLELLANRESLGLLSFIRFSGRSFIVGLPGFLSFPGSFPIVVLFRLVSAAETIELAGRVYVFGAPIPRGTISFTDFTFVLDRTPFGNATNLLGSSAPPSFLIDVLLP